MPVSAEALEAGEAADEEAGGDAGGAAGAAEDAALELVVRLEAWIASHCFLFIIVFQVQEVIYGFKLSKKSRQSCGCVLLKQCRTN